MIRIFEKPLEINDLHYTLTVHCNLLILLDIFFFNEINDLAGEAQVMVEVLILSIG